MSRWRRRLHARHRRSASWQAREAAIRAARAAEAERAERAAAEAAAARARRVAAEVRDRVAPLDEALSRASHLLVD